MLGDHEKYHSDFRLIATGLAGLNIVGHMHPSEWKRESKDLSGPVHYLA